MVATAAVSAGVGLLVAAASRFGPATFAGLVMPGGLSLLTLPPQDAPNPVRKMLTFPLRRLYECMGDDTQDWCNIRLDAAKRRPRWIAEAVDYYYYNVQRGVRDGLTRSDLDGWRDSIAEKISIVEQIDEDTTPGQVRVLLHKHRFTMNIRRYLDEDDPLRVARRLQSDALTELELFLACLYRLGYHKLLIYPFRPSVHRTPARRLAGPPPARGPARPREIAGDAGMLCMT
jgi:hypothetical protein